MSAHDNIPNQFKAREPSKNITNESGSLVRYGFIYAAAIDNYLKAINKNKNVTAETACRQANKAIERLEQMINQYRTAAMEQSLYPDIGRTSNWPIYDLTKYAASNLYARPGTQSTKFNFNVSKNMIDALNQVICPPTNCGIMYQTHETRIYFEIDAIDEDKRGYTVLIYSYHMLPKISIQLDGMVQQKNEPNPNEMMLTHIGKYHIYLKTDKKRITMDAFHIDCLEIHTPQEIYTAIKPKQLRWNKQEIRLWEDSIIQSYTDFDAVFAIRKLPINVIFAYFYLNIILMANLYDIKEQKAGTYTLTSPIRLKYSSQITIQKVPEIIPDIYHMTPNQPNLLTRQTDKTEEPETKNSSMNETEKLEAIRNDVLKTQRLFGKQTARAKKNYRNWFKERDTNA